MSYHERRFRYTWEFQYRQLACFQTAEIDEIKKLASSGGGWIHEKPGKIVEPDVCFEKDDEDCNLECIMTVEEVDASGLQGELRALQEKYIPASLEVPEDMLAVVALTEQSLDLGYELTARQQALGEVERKLQVASIAVLSAQHSALANAEEASKCRGELKETGEQ